MKKYFIAVSGYLMVAFIFGAFLLGLIIQQERKQTQVFSSVTPYTFGELDEQCSDDNMLKQPVLGSDGKYHDGIPAGEVPVLLPGTGYRHFRNWYFADGFHGPTSRYRTFKLNDPRIHKGNDGRYYFMGWARSSTYSHPPTPVYLKGSRL